VYGVKVDGVFYNVFDVESVNIEKEIEKRDE
jgi:hypothetical protein